MKLPHLLRPGLLSSDGGQTKAGNHEVKVKHLACVIKILDRRSQANVAKEPYPNAICIQ